MKLQYAIVFVSDMNRSVAFYRDVIGLPLKFESPHWTEFATEGSTLALHPAGRPGSSEEPECGKSRAGTVQLGFPSSDIEAAHARFTRLGVKCIMPPTKQDFGGILALYCDPDNQVICISQIPA